MPSQDKQQLRRKNVRLGLTLGGVALVFFVGIIVKHLLFP